ncbi:undecaprenyldiphospho-muramoylpentapeptide beta-N-acetylglucosaminyltransferase [Teredinibacter haidensis]|uniref:undecaprenyldiphospho-muramoylpentapeptide beta-N-acetylglucosaminyltransferase n=1 Tax=Teredinibacter haidensis TaxID=2731755 RepID=UPI0009491139|nr:undecaprenyldiphospho-muramoylpentapeptide beta-N-acetylglucosaminyltransferase [Teredinibacter haidensis]
MAATKRVLVTAGGTGGHVFPGLALANELQSRGYEIHWLGTNAGIESRLVSEAKIPLHMIDVKGLRGKGVLLIFAAPFNIVRAVWQAVNIVKKVSPDLIVGLGGFVAGPGGIAAKLTGRPLLIHEQNAVAGTTNKILALMANRVLTAFPNVLSKGVCIGNPVRDEFYSCKMHKAENNGRINLLVVGGSRGARALNQLLPDVIAQMGEKAGSLAVLHQTGGKLLVETKEEYQQKGITYSNGLEMPEAGEVAVVDFIDDMASCYQWADIVLCRSGALTVSELAASGVASILVPFPFAIDDHQTENAKYLVDAGAAILWPQSAIDSKKIAQKLQEFIDGPSQLVDMGLKAEERAKPLATKQFADVCEQLINVMAGTS